MPSGLGYAPLTSNLPSNGLLRASESSGDSGPTLHLSSFAQAMRVFSSIPWRTLLAVMSLTGPRVSAGLIDLVISVSFGGRTLLER